MEYKYIYRKHLRKPAKFFLILLLMFIIPYVSITVPIALSSNQQNKILIALGFLAGGFVFLVFISLEFVFIYFVMYRRFKKIYVNLTDDGIIYNNAKGEIKVPYEDIKYIQFPSIKYMGGWIKINHSRGSIRLTVVLENIGDMINNLKNKLDQKNIIGKYDERAIYNFFKTAKYSDQSWERIYENAKYFISIVIGAFVVTAVFLTLITNVPLKFLVFICALIELTIAFIIPEAIFGRKLAKESSQQSFYVPNRDKQFEAKVYKWTLGIYFVLFIFSMIVLKVLSM
ncbi:MAG: hypothetical protein Q8900_07680 [Bacillota bacterium]|nr:hypothetical protein [Bacillota bacterium]